MSSRTLLIVAGILGALGIAIGAFGAHALPNVLKDLSEADMLKRREWLETGSRYHMYHVLALLGIAMVGERWSGRFSSACIAWIIGVFVFSGCLYAMAVTGNTWLGRIVPIGGASMLIGWVLLAIQAWRIRPDI